MRRSDSLNTFSCLSLYGLLTRFCTGALRVSQVLKRFSPYMPRPSTPAESPASCLYRCSLIGFQSIYTVALRFDNVTRLYSFRDGATPLTACMIPCVRLHCVVRFFFSSPPFRSSTVPTLSTGGWLFLTRQGLPPCKKRQAFLGAQTGVPQRPHLRLSSRKAPGKTLPCRPKLRG